MHDRLDCLEERTDAVEEHITEMGKAHDELFVTLLPNLSFGDMLIDGAHRIAKHDHLPA